MFDLDFATAIEKAVHLKALGDTTVYLRGDEGFPYDKVCKVETGGIYRLGGPASCYLFAEQDGLTFKLSVDFEGRDADGKGVSLFDRDKLRNLSLKLSEEGRNQFAAMLENEVLPPMKQRTQEIRDALRQQADSEDCIRGLISFAREAA